jgi:hypothetical protein
MAAPKGYPLKETFRIPKNQTSPLSPKRSIPTVAYNPFRVTYNYISLKVTHIG